MKPPHGRPPGGGQGRPPQGGKGRPGGSGFGRPQAGGQSPRRPDDQRGRGEPDHGGPRHARGESPNRPFGGPRPDHAGRPPRRFDDRPPRRPAEEETATWAPRPGHGGAGGHWLYGLHAAAAALGNPARRLRRLVVTEEAEAALAARVKQPWAIAPERLDRGQIDRLLGRDAVHQGIGLLADPLPPPPLAAVLERPGPLLVLDQVTDPRNVGAILRSAAAFGAAGVVVQDRNAPEETGTLAKAASGALETVPLLRAVNLARTLVALKAAGIWTVGLDAGGGPLSGPALAQRRVALVLGAEGEGLRRLTRETCDEVAGLPMPGGFESLNVSAAAAVALYELSRR